jgi:hypothetical protein
MTKVNHQTSSTDMSNYAKHFIYYKRISVTPSGSAPLLAAFFMLTAVMIFSMSQAVCKTQIVNYGVIVQAMSNSFQ